MTPWGNEAQSKNAYVGKIVDDSEAADEHQGVAANPFDLGASTEARPHRVKSYIKATQPPSWGRPNRKTPPGKPEENKDK